MMKKKLLFVISRMAVGGSQRSLVNALKNIDSSRYDVSLYVREDKTELLNEVPKEVRVVVNKNKAKYDHDTLTRLYEVLIRIAKRLNRQKMKKRYEEKTTSYVVRKKTAYEKKHYDILNEEYDIAISYLQGYVCKFTADVVRAKRKICFFHSSTDALSDIHRTYLPKYEKIIVVNQETQRFLRERYPSISDRFVVIPNFVDIEQITSKSQEFRIDKKDSAITLCTCGRMSPEKGYDLAVKAARELSAKDIRFIWYFIGGGPEFIRIKEEIDAGGLPDQIILLGNQSNPYPWIAGCDIYVQPSYEEAQPLAIMEAQLLHKPIVSTDTVGARSLITNRHDGLLTEIDPDSLAAGIAYLAEHQDERERLVHNLDDDRFLTYNDRIKQQWNVLLTESKNC